jgi:hypothetical protein
MKAVLAGTVSAGSGQTICCSGALHGFDAPHMTLDYEGHHVGREPDAAADALVVTQAFLAQRLSP